MEQWRNVIGFESLYEVSDEGRVRHKVTGKLRTLTPQGPGQYIGIRLYRNNVGYGTYVHILVAESFLGPKSQGTEVRHLDGRSYNSAANNLAWGTSQQNATDTLMHGNNIQCKLTDEQVHFVRNLPSRRPSQQAANDELTFQGVAKDLGISEVTFYNVRNRRTYKHLE